MLEAGGGGGGVCVCGWRGGGYRLRVGRAYHTVTYQTPSNNVDSVSSNMLDCQLKQIYFEEALFRTRLSCVLVVAGYKNRMFICFCLAAYLDRFNNMFIIGRVFILRIHQPLWIFSFSFVPLQVM